MKKKQLDNPQKLMEDALRRLDIHLIKQFSEEAAPTPFAPPEMQVKKKVLAANVLHV